MAIKHRTPERNNPLFSTVVYPGVVPTSLVLSTAGGVRTLTAAEIMSGWLDVDCQDAQTMTLPTATLLVAAIPGCRVGTSFEFVVVNYGDTTITVGLGTGITKTTIATVATVMTLVTLASKRFFLNCTGVNGIDGATADAWVVRASGSTAAAVA